ncbi:hypothetical protein Vafri_12491 [Volvox africanus]|uniref:Uncharacterized protein n=1 Tax=Volvox africanus TaxID=51714 RepID=A0A8J4BA58_9CHLO|nr:hypothetical protein Vafri_12491 [Volvox africanus]
MHDLAQQLNNCCFEGEGKGFSSRWPTGYYAPSHGEHIPMYTDVWLSWPCGRKRTRQPYEFFQVTNSEARQINMCRLLGCSKRKAISQYLPHFVLEPQAANASMNRLEDETFELAARVGCVACILG